MTPSEFEKICCRSNALTEKVDRLTQSMLPKPEDCTSGEQLLAETAGLNTEEKVAYYQQKFGSGVKRRGRKPKTRGKGIS